MRRTLLALLALAAALAAALWVGVRNLDHPWVKERVRALARSTTGLELDYRAVHLGLTRLRIEDLVVLSPESVRALAPELVRIGAVEARWTASSLLADDAPRLTSLSLEGVTVAVVEDAQGGGSLDAFPPSKPLPGRTEPPQPISRRVAEALSRAPPVARVDLEGADVTLIRAAGGSEVERARLRGLAAHVVTERRAPGWELQAELGSPARPLDLALERAGHGGARFRLALSAAVNGEGARASVDLAVAGQTLVPDLEIRQALRLEASCRFDPAAGLTEVNLARLEAADGSLDARGTLVLPDDGEPLLRKAEGQVDLVLLLRHVPADLVPLRLGSARASFQVRGLRLAATPALDRDGLVRLDAVARGVVARAGPAALELATAQLSLEARPEDDSPSPAKLVRGVGGGVGLRGHASASLEGLKLASGARRVEATGIAATMAGFVVAGGGAEAEIDLRTTRLAVSDAAGALRSRALTLRIAGSVLGLSPGAPWLVRRGELAIDHPEVHLPSGPVRAERVELKLRASDDRSRRTADAELAVRGLAAEVKASGGTSRVEAASMAATIAGSLAAGGGADAKVDLRTARLVASGAAGALRSRALTLRTAGRVEGFSPGAPWLVRDGALAMDDAELRLPSGPVRAERLELTLRASGDRSRRTADAELAVRRLSAEAKASGGGPVALSVPTAALGARYEAAAGHHATRIDVQAEALRLALGPRQVELAGLSDRLEVESDDPAAGEATIVQVLQIGGVRQDFLVGYPVGEVSLEVRARRDREGTISASRIRLDNRAAGTALELSGTARLEDWRRALSLRAELTQDLARAWTGGDLFEGRGTLAVDAQIDSADLSLFRAVAGVRLAGAELRLRRAGISVESLDAEIPAEVAFSLGARGFSLVRQTKANAFSELRFADQHPFQSRRSFLSVARLVTPALTAAPLAGNLEVSGGVVSLSQLEMGIRNGLVTGQCSLELSGADPVLLARIRASGVESSRGEPFDGNLAVSISTRDRRVDGRAEILRIGRRHLLDLLDFQDPQHADPGLNQIRTALRFGYPDHVRLSFRQGFASLGVTFGGLARLLKLEEVRGIPVGALLDRALSSMSRTATEAP